MGTKFLNNKICPICCFNIKIEDNDPVPNQQENKKFYDKFLKIVHCQICKIGMHEICLGKGKKKITKCHSCEFKDQEKQSCIICQKTWGMKKKIKIDNQKVYAHLPCLFFSNDFYCESFSQHIYHPLRSINQKNSNDICIVCEKGLNTNSVSHFKCIECPKICHMNCGFLLEAQCYQSFENEAQVNLNSLEIPMLSYLQEFELQLIDAQYENEDYLKQILKSKKYDQLQKQNTEFLLANPKLFLPNKIQKAVFQMTCLDHQNIKYKYCCHQDNDFLNQFDQIQCDYCNDWIHGPCFRQGSELTDIEKYLFICVKCKEFSQFVLDRGNTDAKNKNPPCFFHYFIMCLVLEQEENKELIQKFSESFFVKKDSFQINHNILYQIDELKQQTDKDHIMKQLQEYLKMKENMNFLIDKFKEIKSVYNISQKNQITLEQMTPYETEVLNMIFNETKEFFEEPTQVVLDRIQVKTKKFFEDKNFKNLKPLINDYIIFMKENFIGPLFQFVERLENFIEQNSQKMNIVFQNEMKPFFIDRKVKNYKIEDLTIFEKYQQSKIPFESFKQFLNEQGGQELFQNYCQKIFNLNDQFKNFLEQSFESLSVTQVHETFENIYALSFRPSISLNEKIEVFLQNYYQFIENEKKFLNYKNKVKMLSKFQNEKMRDFLEQDDNLKYIISMDFVLEIINKQKYPSLIKHYFPQGKFEQEKIQVENSKFVESCINHEGSLKSLVKPFLKNCIDNKILVSNRAMKFIGICMKEYQFRRILEKQSLTKDELQKILSELDEKYSDSFVRNKGKMKLRDLIKFENNISEKLNKISYDQINVSEYIESLKQLMDKRKNNIPMIEQYYLNVRFANEIIFFLDNKIEFGTDPLKVIQINYKTISQKLKNTDLTSLEKINKIEFNVFINEVTKKLFLKANKIYYQKIFSEQKNKIPSSYFDKENQFPIKECFQTLEINNSFSKRKKNYEEFQQLTQQFKQLFLNLSVERDILNEQMEISQKILQLSESFLFENQEIISFLNFVNKVRISTKIIIKAREFIKLKNNPEARKTFEENETLYHELKNIIKENLTSQSGLLTHEFERLLVNFLDEYRKFEESKIKSQEYQNKQRKKFKKNQERMDKSYLILVQQHLKEFEFCHKKLIEEITLQLQKVESEEEQLENQNKELFSKNFHHIINSKLKLENSIQQANKLICRSEIINKSRILYESLLKLVSCHQQQKIHWDKAYQEFSDKFDLEQPLFQEITQMNVDFNTQNEILIQLQTLNDDDNFGNNVQSIWEFSFGDTRTFDLCYNYDNYEEFKKDIEISKLLIKEDYRNYFMEIYHPSNTQRIIRIYLPDYIREKIKKKVEMTQMIKEKYSENLLNSDINKKLELFVVIEKEFGGQLIFFQDTYIEQLYKNIDEERKQYFNKFEEIKKELLIFNEYIYKHYQDQNNLQGCQKEQGFDEKIEESYCLSKREKVYLLLINWLHKIFHKMYQFLLINSQNPGIKELFQDNQLNTISQLAKKISDKFFTRLSYYMNNLLNWCLTFINSEQQKIEIKKLWKFNRNQNLTQSLSQKDFWKPQSELQNDFKFLKNYIDNICLLQQLKIILEYQNKFCDKDKKEIHKNFLNVLSGQNQEQEKKIDQLSKIKKLLKKIFQITCSQESQFNEQLINNFNPGFEKYQKENEKGFSSFNNKLIGFIKKLNNQPNNQNKIKNSKYQFEVIKNIMDKEREKDFQSSLNDQDELENVQKRKLSVDLEDHQVYNGILSNLKTSEKIKEKKREKNKKVMEKIENEKKNNNLFYLSKNSNEIYELNIERITLEGKRIFNLQFLTSSSKVLQIENFTEIIFNGQKVNKRKISDLLEVLPKNDSRDIDWNRIIIGWIKFGEGQQNSFVNFYNGKIEKKHFMQCPQVMNQKPQNFLIVKYIELEASI